jgi:histidine ammonia-lyase 1
MGSIAAKKSKDILENVRKVIGMELITACQAIDLKGAKDKLSPATKVAYDEVRKVIPYVAEDRPMYIDIHAAEEIVRNNKLVEDVEKAIGQLEF